MFKSVFSASSLASVAGLIAICAASACSDDETKTVSATNEPAATPGQDAPPKAPPSTSNEATDDDEDDPSAAPTCMDTSTPFDVDTVSYHPPAIQKGACTKADVKVFDDYFREHPQGNINDIKDTLTKQNQRCGDCAFGAVDDERWAAVVLDASSATVNGGGCVAAVSGEDDCGKAYQQWNTCLNTVCASCTDQGERTQCSNDAQQPSAPCGDPSSSLFKACGKDVNTFLKTCFGSGMGAVLENLCGSPSAASTP